MDQASSLRRIVGNRGGDKRDRKPSNLTGPDGKTRVISITSGKGGVGKSNVVLNLCLALAKKGKRVFLLDADMGLANVDVLLGMTPQYTLEHFFSGERTIAEVVLTGPDNMRILPSGSGISELSELTFDQQQMLFSKLKDLGGEIDYLFIDTGAGISSNVLRFNASAGEVLIVANAEPTSITDAYALMKLLATKYQVRHFGLVANSVNSQADGQNVYDTLNRVCGQFLQVELHYLGWIPFDAAMRKAVRSQKPVMIGAPTAPAARNLLQIANWLTIHRIGKASDSITEPDSALDFKTQGFWDRLLHWKKL